MVFWRRRQPQPPVVSCYGKLPATGDFIRLNAGGQENSAFDDWLGSSVAHAKQLLEPHFRQLYEPALGLFIYRGHDGEGGEEPERGMIGAWASSGDSAGRRYPMLVSTSYDYDQLLGVGAALPIAMWPFLVSAYDLVSNGRSLPVEEFLGRVSRFQPLALEPPAAAAAPYQSWLQQNTMRAFWETLYGTVDGRYAVIHSLLATVEIFRGHERPRTQLAIRLPVRAADAYAVAVWMDMVVRLARWQRTLLNAFWTPQHDLVLHVGPPQLGTFRELLTDSGNAEHITDLMRPPLVDAHAAKNGLGALAAVVDNPDVSICAFLNGLAA